ncbi:sugar phosphate isomerase/epimerase, partial [Xanthomonas citri pv. citri]|nr:sugar phosphate isomerase/epimerase [Xanthomonas citri pv. citri]
DQTDSRWRDLLNQLPADAPRGIEFPLEGTDLTAVTRHYVNLLREE